MGKIGISVKLTPVEREQLRDLERQYYKIKEDLVKDRFTSAILRKPTKQESLRNKIFNVGMLHVAIEMKEANNK